MRRKKGYKHDYGKQTITEAFCPKTSKMSFASRDDAKLYRSRRTAAGFTDMRDLDVYRCTYCDWFHLGHRVGETRQEDREVHQQIRDSEVGKDPESREILGCRGKLSQTNEKELL